MKYKVKSIHFVGIGGSGMSGIAEVLLNLGYKISGSDITDNDAIQRLYSLGAKINFGHAAVNVTHADVIVTSSAVQTDNPEILAAHKENIPVVPRAVMLAELMRLKNGIAIAGTHGKTTTTGLVASVLAQGALDPTFVIGGHLNSIGSSAKLGLGSFIVVEADESDASFLNLSPVIEVITNISADHMGTYQHDFEKLKQAFVDFTHRLPFYGVVILCIDNTNIYKIMEKIPKRITTYGFHTDADVRAVDARTVDGYMQFNVIQKDYESIPITLNQPGMHNIQNACAAIAVARELGIIDTVVQKALVEFSGVSRRFTRYGEVKLKSSSSTGRTKFALIDDYGHHPVEIQATILAARGVYPNRRLVLIFQPHRYTRTRDLFEDFMRVLSTVDVLILLEVYSAGESPIIDADGRALAHVLRVAGMTSLVFAQDMNDIPALLPNIICNGDVVITMGAGSISNLPSQLIEFVKE